MKSCPRCRVQHLDAVDLCDCGYRFSTGSLDRVNSASAKSGPVVTILSGLTILVVAGIAGSFVRNIVRSGGETMTSGVMSVEDMLQIASKDMNATLPLMVDKATQLDRVSAGPGKTYTYHFTLVAVTSSNVTQQQFNASTQRARAKAFVCTNPDMSKFRQEGVVVVYSYRGKDGGLIDEIATNPMDCG